MPKISLKLVTKLFNAISQSKTVSEIFSFFANNKFFRLILIWHMLKSASVPPTLQALGTYIQECFDVETFPHFCHVGTEFLHFVAQSRPEDVHSTQNFYGQLLAQHK